MFPDLFRDANVGKRVFSFVPLANVFLKKRKNCLQKNYGKRLQHPNFPVCRKHNNVKFVAGRFNNFQFYFPRGVGRKRRRCFKSDCPGNRSFVRKQRRQSAKFRTRHGCWQRNNYDSPFSFFLDKSRFLGDCFTFRSCFYLLQNQTLICPLFFLPPLRLRPQVPA